MAYALPELRAEIKALEDKRDAINQEIVELRARLTDITVPFKVGMVIGFEKAPYSYTNRTTVPVKYRYLLNMVRTTQDGEVRMHGFRLLKSGKVSERSTRIWHQFDNPRIIAPNLDEFDWNTQEAKGHE